MSLNNIHAPKGANKNRKRIGRGHGSGWGKTAGKGHKGQRSRSGGGIAPGFEGGQMPLARRIPKFGFTNIFRKNIAEVKLQDLAKIEGDVIDAKSLFEAGLVKLNADAIKILGNGDIDRAVTVRVDKITKSAREKIEKAGGTIELIPESTPIIEVAATKAAKLSDDVIDLAALIKGGLVPEGTERVRIVNRGPLNTAKTWRIELISRDAQRAIKNAGGKIEEID